MESLIAYLTCIYTGMTSNISLDCILCVSTLVHELSGLPLKNLGVGQATRLTRLPAQKVGVMFRFIRTRRDHVLDGNILRNSWA